MEELEIGKYSLLEKPLKEVSINKLFARAVIEKKVRGKVFVDRVMEPKTYYVVHPYGMSLLFGENNNRSFNNQFLDYCLNRSNRRVDFEWMQAFPKDWKNTLKLLFQEKLVRKSESGETPKEFIELNTRVNFKFEVDRYRDFKKKYLKIVGQIRRTDVDSFNKMQGNVVPANFWDSADDFYQNGVGFSLFHKGKLATTAYSAFIFDNELELGMETLPEFRGKGFAQYTCSALIDFCLQHDYEPVWACNLTNKPSFNLAKKLGFVPKLTLPYYRLAL